MSARKEILIVDKKGRPQASQVVGLYNSSSALVATATTDSYGMAIFASIADGLYSVSGTRGAYTSRSNADVLVFDPSNADNLNISGVATIGSTLNVAGQINGPNIADGHFTIASRNTRSQLRLNSTAAGAMYLNLTVDSNVYVGEESAAKLYAKNGIVVAGTASIGLMSVATTLTVGSTATFSGTAWTKDVAPTTDNANNIGAATKRYANVYANNVSAYGMASISTAVFGSLEVRISNGAGDVGAVIRNNATTDAETVTFYGRLTTASSNDIAIRGTRVDGSNTKMELMTNNAGTLTPAMTVDQSQNVKFAARIGFFGGSPSAKPTSIVATASSIWRALTDLGLIA